MMFTFVEFLQWEESSRDTIDFKLIYADIAQDVLGGLVLSELVYWHLPSRSGISRMRVVRDNHEWVVAQRAEWWKRTRMTPRQIDNVVTKLVDRNLVIKSVHKFGRANALFLRINQEVFMDEWHRVLNSPPIQAYEGGKAKARVRKSPNGEIPNGDSQNVVNHQTVNSIYTETTSTENTESAPKGAKPPKEKPERKPRTPDPEFDPVFEAVAEKIFAHAQWLTGRYNGRDASRITKLPHPAKAEHVAYFVQWWQQSKPNVDLPQNLIAFATHWQTWGSERRKEIEQGKTPIGWKPAPPQAQIAPQTPEEREKRKALIESQKRGA
jgi:hypothetical protein